MAVYYPGCDTEELPDYICDDCNDFEKGRVRSIFIVLSSYYATFMANPTSLLVWQTGINNGSIIIINKVVGTFEPGDPITGPGYGDEVETKLGRDYVLNWRDPSYKKNCNFYNILEKVSAYYGYRTGSQCHIATKPTTADASNPVTENIEDNVEWNGSAKWRDSKNPCPFDTPAGIFEQCFAIQ